MYWETPHGACGSGWRFSTGDESEGYANDTTHLSIYHVNTMRGLAPIIVLLTVAASCDRPAAPAPATIPVYAPETFRQNIAALIGAKDYAGAAALVRAADVERQLTHDRTGYVAIGGDKIYLPGLGESSEYDCNRDWYMPGTSDAIEDAAWQSSATAFAERYNLRRSGRGG
jgi:hypothetical protein